MKAKEFENLCLQSMEQAEKRGRATMGRYGVQATFAPAKLIDLTKYAEMLKPRVDIMAVLRKLQDEARSTSEGWRPLQSYPDFEGIIATRGQQFIFDAKVCGESNLRLNASHTGERQLGHLRWRSKFGAVCFFLIHFTARELKKSSEAAQTWAFPVRDDHPFWQAFDREEVKVISRTHCQKWAVPVAWAAPPRGTVQRPNILDAIFQLAEIDAATFARGEFKASPDLEMEAAAKPF